MPYRVDIDEATGADFDRLVELGALDAEMSDDHRLAALLPDSVTPAHVARALGLTSVAVSRAEGRDADSVWMLRPRPLRVASLRIVPAAAGDADHPTAGGRDDGDRDLKLLDAMAFGSGFHPTTTLCLEAIADIVRFATPRSLLDVGTGSGVLALAALLMGVEDVVGIDVDGDALRTAAANARLNGLRSRLRLVQSTPAALAGRWPLIAANVLAAPLIEMARAIVPRVAHQGYLVLSGIPASVEPDVGRAYRRLGMRPAGVHSRGGWVALVLQASW